jgi:hypothetical protein
LPSITRLARANWANITLRRLNDFITKLKGDQMRKIELIISIAVALVVSSSAFSNAFAQSNYEVDAVKRLNVPQQKRMDILTSMGRVAWAMVASDYCPAAGRLSLRDRKPRFSAVPEAMRQEMLDSGVPEGELDGEAFKDLVVASYDRVLRRAYYGAEGAFCLAVDSMYGPSGHRRRMLKYFDADAAAAQKAQKKQYESGMTIPAGPCRYPNGCSQ